MTVDQETLSDKIAATVDAYIERLTERNVDRMLELFADGATVEDPVGTEPKTTRDQLREFYGVVAGLDECKTDLKWKKIAADTAVFEFILLTTTGGSTFQVTTIDIMTFDENGKIASMRAVWGPADFTQVQ